MRESSRNWRFGCRAAVVLAGLAASPVAWALPWNIDMADSDTVKAYEARMRPLPEGVVAQPNVITPIGYTRNYVRETPEGQALTNPFPADGALMEQGERMYGVYCTPCHGDGVQLGPVAQPGRYAGVAVLGGENGRLKVLSDGHVYLTIRNGGGIMPSYSWAMNDQEMWAIVAWMRKGIKDAAAPAAPPGSVPVPTSADGGAPAPGTPAAAPAGQAAPTTPPAPAKEGQ